MHVLGLILNCIAPPFLTTVDRYLGSEMPVFLELRVRYLMANQKVCEATSLAKACAQHSSLGRHLFFLQVYLTFLWKASHHDHLRKVVSGLCKLF